MKNKNTPQQIRLQLAYSDSNFQKEAKTLLKSYLDLLKNTPLDQAFIDNVADGYVRKESIEKFTPSILQQYETLLDYYSISESELINYYHGNLAPVDGSVEINLPDRNDPQSTYRIAVHAGARGEDVLRAFYEIQRLHRSLGHKDTRSKGPYDPLLLYRVRQMKIKGYDYKTIAEMIAADMLPGYKTMPDLKSDWTPEELKQYYNRYKKYVDKTVS